MTTAGEFEQMECLAEAERLAEADMAQIERRADAVAREWLGRIRGDRESDLGREGGRWRRVKSEERRVKEEKITAKT